MSPGINLDILQDSLEIKPKELDMNNKPKILCVVLLVLGGLIGFFALPALPYFDQLGFMGIGLVICCYLAYQFDWGIVPTIIYGGTPIGFLLHYIFQQLMFVI